MVDSKRLTFDTADNGSRVVWKHFKGDKFDGVPTFNLELDDDLATEFQDAGWPVAMYIPKNGGDTRYSLKIKLKFKNKDGNRSQLNVVVKDMVTGKKSHYDENNIGDLDNVQITRAVIDIYNGWAETYQRKYIGVNNAYFEIESRELDRLMDMDDDDSWLKEDANTL